MSNKHTQCDICRRSWSSRRPFQCVACAKAQLYGPRIQHTLLQLETEDLGQQIERHADTFVSRPSASETGLSPERATFEIRGAGAEKAAAEDRIQAIDSQTHSLRTVTQNLREELDVWKVRLAGRRKALDAAKYRLDEEQKHRLTPVRTSVEKRRQQWEALHAKTVEARVFLCREAAILYGFTQRRKRVGSEGRDAYYIGGLPIFDLREINNASPTPLTASTSHLAHLLHLISHYLAVRLPAEITLPHKDYPHPTIFSPASSYRGRNVPFPGSNGASVTQSSHNSPTTSRHTAAIDSPHNRPPPKPRPLYLAKKLGVLARDDAIAYGAFVDGIALLAWDIAWLCKSQGMDISGGKGGGWEEICAMGKNLWMLLFGEEAINANLGQASHGARHSFLGIGTFAESLRSWRLRDATKIVERVRGMLVAERTGADWEVVMDEEIAKGEGLNDNNDEGGEQRGGIIVPQVGLGNGDEGGRDHLRGGMGLEDTMRMEGMGRRRESTRTEQVDGRERERGKGMSGWTRIRERTGF